MPDESIQMEIVSDWHTHTNTYSWISKNQLNICLQVLMFTANTTICNLLTMQALAEDTSTPALRYKCKPTTHTYTHTHLQSPSSPAQPLNRTVGLSTYYPPQLQPHNSMLTSAVAFDFAPASLHRFDHLLFPLRSLTHQAHSYYLQTLSRTVDIALLICFCNCRT